MYALTSQLIDQTYEAMLADAENKGMKTFLGLTGAGIVGGTIAGCKSSGASGCVGGALAGGFLSAMASGVVSMGLMAVYKGVSHGDKKQTLQFAQKSFANHQLLAVDQNPRKVVVKIVNGFEAMVKSGFVSTTSIQR